MYVYIMSRPDGWHKIGMTMSTHPRWRAQTIQFSQPRGSGRIKLVRFFRLNFDAPAVESIAHKEMSAMGYPERQGEWFNAGAAACSRAIRRARRRLKAAGGRHAWDALQLKWASRRREQRIRLGTYVRRDKPGKPSRDGDYTAEQIERARRAWADTYSYQTIDVALAHMPAGWTARMARDRWGPRPKRRKRKK